MHPQSLLNFLLNKASRSIVNPIGSKIISKVNKHYLTYDLLKYCLCSDIVMRLSPNSSIYNPIATYLNLIFCFSIENTALWYLHAYIVKS